MSTIRVFASHDWGKGAANHARVASVVTSLRKRNIRVWFDETHMKGNILDAMCKGIEDSDVVLIFVTCNYMKKVEQGGDTDNVRREFMFASATPEKLVPIRFDDDLPRTWSGPLRMILGTQLYVDMSVRDIPDSKIDELVDAIRRATPRTMWKNAVAQTRVVPKVAPKPPTKTPALLKVDSREATKPLTIRNRVDRLREAVGDTSDGHIKDIVVRLAATLLGTVDENLPMVERVARMERELGLV